MKILGIESAAMTASAAVWEDDRIVAEYTTDYKKTHSQTLLPMIAAIRDMIELNLESLDGIAVSGGPGSFTGLRIGSTTAKGLGLALDKPLIHVPTLDAMAYQAFGTDMLILAMLDARKGFVFAGIYTNTVEDGFRVVKPAHHINISDLAAELDELAGENEHCVLMIGDGADAYGNQLQEMMQHKIIKAPSFSRRARAGAVAALGAVMYAQGLTESAAAHAPDYLRVSQAERQMEKARAEGVLKD